MADVWSCGFEFTLDPTQIFDLVTYAGGGTAPTLVAALGRVASNALKIPARSISGSGWGYVQKNIPYDDEYILGFSLDIPIGQSASHDTIICSFVDGSTTQVDLRIRPDGHVRVTRNGTVLATSSLPLVFGESHYFEIYVKVHGSTGAVTVRMDEANLAELVLTNQNTSATGVNQIGAFRFGGNYSGSQTVLLFYIDDVILLDKLGGYLDNFIGDHHLALLRSDGATADDDFTPVGEATAWEALRTVPPNLAKYIESALVTNKTLCTYEDLPSTVGAIAFASVWSYASKNDGGARAFRSDVLSGASEADNGADIPLSTGKAYYRTSFRNDPATAVAWTRTGINAAKFGVIDAA